MSRALLVVVDLLVLAAAILVAAVALTGGFTFELGPVAFSSHDASRPLVALGLLVAVRLALSRRRTAGVLGLALALLLATRRRRRWLAAILVVVAVVGAGRAALLWQRERDAARRGAEQRAALFDRRGAATLVRTTRPLPERWADPAGSSAGRRWITPVGPVSGGRATLTLHYGLMADASRWGRGTVTFRAAFLEAGSTGAGQPVFEGSLEAAAAAAGPEWRSTVVDLSRWAGRAGRLLLETVADRGDSAARYAFWARPASSAPPPEGPNVVLVSLDTLRADRLGCYGYAARPTSPEIDALAATGTRFALAIAPAPWTTPSHMSLFTSQWPTVHAVDAPIESSQRRLASAKTTLAEVLRERGYRTAAFTGAGAISAVYGFWQGFDVYDETSRGATGREGEDLPIIYDRALAWIESHRDRPFFLFLHTYEIHNPYTHATFVGDAPLEEAERRSRLYDGGIAFADAYIGRLRKDLRRLGLEDRTLVVLLSDHGEDLAGRYPQDRWYYHGHDLYDELLRVPLIIAGPGVAAGRVVSEQVSLIDVMPTVLDLVGAAAPEGPFMQGVDLASHLDPAGPPPADRAPGHPYVFAEAVNRGPERKAVRTREHKLVWIPSFDQTGRSRIETPLPEIELLDLRADPGETRNLVASSPALVRDLRDVLEIWLARNRALRREVEEESATLDEATFESLEGLGYIER